MEFTQTCSVCSGTGLGQTEHVPCFKCHGSGEVPLTDKDLKDSANSIGDAVDAVDWAVQMLEAADTLGECELDIAECVRLLKKVSPQLTKTLTELREEIKRN